MHISRKVGAKLLSPECVSSLTTVRHSAEAAGGRFIDDY